MRVLLAHSGYRLRGGEERHLDLLREGLEAQSAEVLTYQPSSSDYAGTKTLALAAGMLYRPSTARAVRRIVTDSGVDVVHVHNLLPVLTPSVLHAAKNAGAGVVLTAHNYRLFCPAGTLMRHGVPHADCMRGSSLMCGLKGARGSVLESLVYGVVLEFHRRFRVIERWVDIVIAPSAYLGEALVRSGIPEDKVRVVPNGVEIRPWQRLDKKYAFFAGRLTHEKGVETLIKAARLAPGVPLVVAGAGPGASFLEHGASHNVEYAGFVSEADVRELRSHAAFVVVPSEWPDIQPFAVVDALAEGKPAIVSDRGGLPELVDERSGRVVPAGDPAALAAALIEMWDESREGDDLSRSAWENARANYDLERQTRAILDLYEEAVAA